MPTFIFSKEDFIKWIDKEVSEDQVVVFTQELTGNISHSEKNGIKLTHRYSPDAFEDKGIGHIAFGKTHPIGLLISEKKRLSEKALKALGNQ